MNALFDRVSSGSGSSNAVRSQASPTEPSQAEFSLECSVNRPSRTTHKKTNSASRRTVGKLVGAATHLWLFSLLFPGSDNEQSLPLVFDFARVRVHCIPNESSESSRDLWIPRLRNHRWEKAVSSNWNFFSFFQQRLLLFRSLDGSWGRLVGFFRGKICWSCKYVVN